jgi:hypothetical protein
MKRLVITESEKQRILGMHSNPSLKGKLFEEYQAFATIKGKAVPVNPAFLEFGKGTAYELRDAIEGPFTNEEKVKTAISKINSQDAYNAALWAIQNGAADGNKYPLIIKYIETDFRQPDNYRLSGGVSSLSDLDGNYSDLKYFSSILMKYNDDERYSTNIIQM